MPFDYSNLPVRPSGRGLTTLAKVLPGVRDVLADVEPYARDWERHNAAAVQADGPLWVVLGDSMAQGIGASSYDRGWPGQLAERLDRRLRLVNLSFHGARTRDALEKQWPAALTLGTPALVTVVIGANDVVWKQHRAGLPAAFAELLAVLPPGAVVANMANPRPEAQEVDRLIMAAETEGRVVRANMRDSRTTQWRGKLARDHFHPNDLGYAAMADVLADTVVRSRPLL